MMTKTLVTGGYSRIMFDQVMKQVASQILGNGIQIEIVPQTDNGKFFITLSAMGKRVIYELVPSGIETPNNPR